MRRHARSRVGNKPLTLSTAALAVTLATLALLGAVVWIMQLQLLD